MNKLQTIILLIASGTLLGAIVRPGVQDILIATIVFSVLAGCFRTQPRLKHAK